jgi:ADP-ribosylglycohydrolase
MWEMETLSGVVMHPMQAAVDAVANLGLDVNDARVLLSQAESLYNDRAYDRLLVCSARINRILRCALAEVPDAEPATWDAYRKLLPTRGRRPPQGRGDVDRVRGAWLGKCIGTALGDPVEGWTRKAIQAEYGRIDRYVRPPETENDDTAYPVLVLHTLDEYGIGFTSEDLALEWIAHLPYAYTAEQTALDNIKAGVMPPDSRWPGNPCGAWVGAQMRGEVHGLIAPGRPEIAAEFAFRDAVISHYREGLDGEIYAAAAISLAFCDLPIERLLREALLYVPSSSPIVETVEQTMDWCHRFGEWGPVIDSIEKAMARYHWIHTLPNLACAVCGLLLGEGSFESTILTTLACGYDTDCSTGQAGALAGAIVGAGGIPQAWSDPIGNALDTYVIGFERIELDRLVEWTTRWSDRTAASADEADSVSSGGRR